MLWTGIKDLKIWTMQIETAKAGVYAQMQEFWRKRYREELPPIPFMDMKQPIEVETIGLDQTIKNVTKSAKKSLIKAILALLLGSFFIYFTLK